MPRQSTPENQKVAIVSDSATGLPENIFRAEGINVAHMTLAINGRSFHNRSIGLSDFYSSLVGGKSNITTSAPSPDEWLGTFSAASKTAKEILCLTVSERISGSLNSANTAAQIASDTIPNITVCVVDSGTAAGAQALIVLELARMARSGASLDQLLSKSSELIEKVRLLAVLDTLTYLRKSGRINSQVFWAGNLLNVKPLVEFNRGGVRSIARSFSRRGSVKRLSKLVVDRAGSGGGGIHLNVMHAYCEEEAKEIKSNIDATLDPVESFLTEFPPFMVAHTGPGLLGIAYYSE